MFCQEKIFKGITSYWIIISIVIIWNNSHSGNSDSNHNDNINKKQ